MTTYEVSRETLDYNIRQLKAMANGVDIWAVIKADGYGLGALPLAEVLSENGIRNFCITDIREAEILRENGFTDEQILMIRSVSDRNEINRLLDLKVILPVGSTETATLINHIAAERMDVAKIHLKIDTGMGRFGFLPVETDKIFDIYRKNNHLAVCGIYTHFNCASSKVALTKKEFAVFQSTVEKIRAAGYETGTVHCCNSAAFLKFPQMYCDAVRLGSAIIGRTRVSSNLRTVGYVSTQIDELRTLPKGHTTGYFAQWKAKRDTQIAILPVGWYHGFFTGRKPYGMKRKDCFRIALGYIKSIFKPKHLMVEINGKACPVVGNIGMQHCAVNVSGVPCQRGDKAIIQMNPLERKGINVVFR